MDVNRKINLKYVSVPLLLSVNSGKYKAVNLNAVAGPQFGLNVGNSLFTSSSSSQDHPQAIVSVKKGDVGLAYGVGMDFGLIPSQNLRFALGFRGLMGLLDISKPSPKLSNDDYYILNKTHLNVYSTYVGISYLFL